MWDDRVELVPAHGWTCPDCGTDHFVRAVAIEMGEEERAATLERLDIEPWQDGTLLTAPIRVQCPDCGRQFGTVEFGGDVID